MTNIVNLGSSGLAPPADGCVDNIGAGEERPGEKLMAGENFTQVFGAAGASRRPWDRACIGLERFLLAQAPVYADVCAELANGRKESHWMWFIFPQLQGLGKSAAARFYGIVDRDEADAYWSHPVLRQRLLRCTRLVLSIRGSTARQIFGSPDDLKLQSCMTLFLVVAHSEPMFGDVLRRHYAGANDPVTYSLVN